MTDLSYKKRLPPGSQWIEFKFSLALYASKLRTILVKEPPEGSY